MRTRVFNVRLTDEAEADLLAMAENVAGKPGNLTAGFYALLVRWRSLEAERDARADRAMAALGYDLTDRIAAQEEKLDALERRAEAEGR